MTRKNSKWARREMETSEYVVIFLVFLIMCGNMTGSNNNSDRYVPNDEATKIFLSLILEKKYSKSKPKPDINLPS